MILSNRQKLRIVVNLVLIMKKSKSKIRWLLFCFNCEVIDNLELVLMS